MIVSSIFSYQLASGSTLLLPLPLPSRLYYLYLLTTTVTTVTSFLFSHTTPPIHTSDTLTHHTMATELPTTNGNGHTANDGENNFAVKAGLARMLKGGVIMDVINAEQVRIVLALPFFASFNLLTLLSRPA